MRPVTALASFVVASAFVLAASTPAEAATTIRDPSPPDYKVEIEPHGILQPGGFFDTLGSTGFGVGGRFSIPIMSPGFVKTINDSIAISFGADLVYFDSYAYWCNGNSCSGNSFWRLYVPVALQWNFWLSDKWSVFGEPGLVLRQPLGACIAGAPCNDSFVVPAFWAGARYHFSDRVALTLRAGFPEVLTVGVSFF